MSPVFIREKLRLDPSKVGLLCRRRKKWNR